jgi:hypothetical protein
MINTVASQTNKDLSRERRAGKSRDIDSGSWRFQ